MGIGIIGRLGPAEAPFRDLASAVGHDVVFHDHVVDGTSPEALGSFIDDCALVVVVVDATPVALANAASDALMRRLRSPVLLHRRDLGKFAGLMAALVAVDERTPPASGVYDEGYARPLLRTGSGTR
jgi:hypothetical protein